MQTFSRAGRWKPWMKQMAETQNALHATSIPTRGSSSPHPCPRPTHKSSHFSQHSRAPTLPAHELLPEPLAKCPQINAANLSASQQGEEPGFLTGSCWHVPTGRVKVAPGFCGSQNGARWGPCSSYRTIKPFQVEKPSKIKVQPLTQHRQGHHWVPHPHMDCTNSMMFWSIPLQCCLRARRNTEVPQAGGGESNLVHQIPKQEVTPETWGHCCAPTHLPEHPLNAHPTPAKMELLETRQAQP